MTINTLENELRNMKEQNAEYINVKSIRIKSQKIYEEEAEGVIRSRVQWWEEDEKSTRYFYQLDKKRGKHQLWDQTLEENGKLLRDTKSIQNRQVQFYKELYKRQKLPQNSIHEMRFLNEIKNQLTEKSKSNLDEGIYLDELSKSLYKMKNNKSPAQDGICVAFYKVYWNDVNNDVLEVFVHGLNNKQLAYSQDIAVIKLLYKNGNRQDMKNWRRISLLNVDYKIRSKALAERIKNILPEIIKTDQRGLIKGRYIG